MLAPLLLAGLASATPTLLRGSWVFRPSNPPKAIAFVLGGAFVGAAPQISYRGLCSELADSGYVVLATPFEMSFDYLEMCDNILDVAEPAYASLVEEYGSLPLIGIGHSCGALLQALLCSVFRGTGSPLADAERRANVLLSFSNKPASSAVPFFGNIVAPSTSSVLQFERDPVLASWLHAVEETRRRLQMMTGDARSTSGVMGSSANTRIGATATELSAQVLPMLSQIEPIIREIDGGRDEFTPSADECERSVCVLYEACSTLVLRFDEDALDETNKLLALLQSGSNNVKLVETPGTHLTLLAPDLGGPGPPLPLPLPLPLATVARGRLASADFDRAMACVLPFLEDAL